MSPHSDADEIRQDRQSVDELKIDKKTRIRQRVRLMDWDKRMDSHEGSREFCCARKKQIGGWKQGGVGLGGA